MRLIQGLVTMVLGLGCRVFRLVLHPTTCAALVNRVQSQYAMHPRHSLPRLQCRQRPGLFPSMPAAQGGSCPVGVLTSIASEHSHLLAHHVRGDRDGAIADEVGAAFAEAEAETGLPCWSRSVPVLLRKSLVAPVEQAMRMCCWMVCSDAMPLCQSSPDSTRSAHPRL
jgi:hypothetical protein